MVIPDSGRTDLARSRTRSTRPVSSEPDARQVSAIVVTEVTTTHTYLDHSLSKHLPSLTDERDKGLTREICYGVMRWYPRLAFTAGMLLNKPLKAKDTDILSLIYIGLYQLMFLRIPDHAAISATVEAARKMHKPWASELINAVLRRYQRESDAIGTAINDTEVARYAHPQWMISILREQWPAQWQTILDANNQHPPFHLRLNLNRQSREQYIQALDQAGINASPGSIADTGIMIDNPVNVEELPGFAQGDVSVQDYAAQLAAPLLDAQPGDRVLDACAAPGGKTAHILEQTPDLAEMVAVEIDADRLKLLRNTLERLNLQASLVHADVCDIGRWWNGEPFDRILIDAPCSATGVIRRHPDIKYMRSVEQLTLLKATQCRILESLWPLLKPGGRLLYITCSVLKEEGDEQIETFINNNDDTICEHINAQWGMKTRYGRHTIPGVDDTDGFYYAVIKKTA